MPKKNHIKAYIFSWFALVFLMLPFLSQSSPYTAFHPELTQELLVEAEDPVSENPLLDKVMASSSQLHPQWNHNVMNIGQAWEEGFTGAGVRIAILDTGFFHQHPDLEMAGGYSVFSDDPWSNDHSGHGTHIAGIIGAESGSTYQGIAPGADIYGIKIYHSDDVDEDGYVSTDTESVAEGIRRAIGIDADIIVISSGLTYHDEALYQEIQNAHAQDIMIIAASGNGHDTVNYPASYPEVVSVTAVDERLMPAMDIISGQENDFAAPGVNIGGLSIPDSTYSYPYIFMSGSSQAVPHAAGLAAILMEKYDARGEEIREIMQQTAANIGDSALFGSGLLRYVSDEEVVEGEPVDEPVAQPTEPTDPASDTTELEMNGDGMTVRKPTSSRAADDNEKTSLSYHQTQALDNGNGGEIREETLSLVESGGTLEIWLDGLNPLRLSEEQVTQLRERNITLVLARENVTWTIPPANFLPGEALLRFYEGMPIGTERLIGNATGIYTTSIYQKDVRRAAYPSWMEVSYDLSQVAIDDLSALEAYYWNKDEREWMPSESEVDGNRLVLKTRHTTALGFFDPERMIVEPKKEVTQDEVAAEADETEDSAGISTETLLGLVVLSVILIIIGTFLRRKNKQK